MRRVGLVLILMALWVLVGVPRLVGAQATPEGSPAAAGCDVAPVALDRATPDAPASAATEPIPENGPAADPETVADLQGTLDELRRCAETGDLARVAALFTPAGFSREVLAEEPVQIEPLPPGATPVAGETTTEPPVVEPGVIDRAVVLEDGSVAAYVDVGTSSPRLVVFVRDASGRWVIDAIEPLAAEATPVSPLGAGDVPGEVWDAVVASLGLTADATITVVELEAVDWPDSSLGCPVEGEFYAQVITPGYRIVVEVNGERSEVHTDLEGNAVACGP